MRGARFALTWAYGGKRHGETVSRSQAEEGGGDCDDWTRHEENTKEREDGGDTHGGDGGGT